jgi:hypothetical protein
VVAGLQRHIGRAAARSLGSSLERGDFGVVEQVVLVPALAGQFSGAIQNHAADGGVGRGNSDAAPRQFEGALHPFLVLVYLLIHARD